MQNEQTLLDLGFKKIPSGEFLFRGKNQKFVAEVVEGTNSFVTLRKIHPDIDRRPLSKTKGCHFRSTIKDCCSSNSVERAIKKYDVPESQYKYYAGGCFLQ